MQTREAEIVKLAAANVIKKEIEKTGGTITGVGTLLGLAGLGFGYSQLFPDSFESSKDWLGDLFPIDWGAVEDWWGDFKESIPFLSGDEEEDSEDPAEGSEELPAEDSAEGSEELPAEDLAESTEEILEENPVEGSGDISTEVPAGEDLTEDSIEENASDISTGLLGSIRASQIIPRQDIGFSYSPEEMFARIIERNKKTVRANGFGTSFNIPNINGD